MWSGGEIHTGRKRMTPELYPDVSERVIIHADTTRMDLIIYNTTTYIAIYVVENETYSIEARIMKPSSCIDETMGFIFKDGREQMGDIIQSLKVLLSYICVKYSHVTCMQINDMDVYTYNDNIKLSNVLIPYLTEGRTIYESQLQGYRDIDREVLFKQHELVFQDKKLYISWDVMKSLITSDLPIAEEDMYTIYTSATNWQAFFGPLATRIGEEQFILFIAPWIRRFIGCYFIYLFSSLEFLLPVHNYHTN
jgi:hypothetical protein